MVYPKEFILKELRRFYAELQRMKFAHNPKVFESEIKRLESEVVNETTKNY